MWLFDKTVRHIGPMAQDFHSAFQLGGSGNDTTITTTDIDGVNMLAIQALEKRTAELKIAQQEIIQKTNEIAGLKSEIGDIKSIMEKQQAELEAIKVYLQQRPISNLQ